MRYDLSMELVLTIDPDLCTESIPDPNRTSQQFGSSHLMDWFYREYCGWRLNSPKKNRIALLKIAKILYPLPIILSSWILL